MKIIHNFVPATYLVKGMQNMMLKGQGLSRKREFISGWLLWSSRFWAAD